MRSSTGKGSKPVSRSSQTQCRNLLARNIVDLLDSFLARYRAGRIHLPINWVPEQENETVCSLLDVEMSSLCSSNVVWGHLQEINRLEIQAHSLSISTNWAYWRVGSSYEAFIEMCSLPPFHHAHHLSEPRRRCPGRLPSSDATQSHFAYTLSRTCLHPFVHGQGGYESAKKAFTEGQEILRPLSSAWHRRSQFRPGDLGV